MSREIKRVPTDFECDGIWPGYQRNCGNANCDGCPDCERQEPPVGEGWQLWETVSEGSPESPVFTTSEELAQWMTTAEHYGCALEAARKFIEDGYAPSLIGTAFGVFKGYEIAAGMAVHLEHLERKAGNDVHLSGTRVRHLTHDTTGVIEHIIPAAAISGTDDRYYLVKWDRGLPPLVEDGDDPAKPMTSACRFDGFEVLS